MTSEDGTVGLGHIMYDWRKPSSVQKKNGQNFQHQHQF
jgi:hypothetical protein